MSLFSREWRVAVDGRVKTSCEYVLDESCCNDMARLYVGQLDPVIKEAAADPVNILIASLSTKLLLRVPRFLLALVKLTLYHDVVSLDAVELSPEA